MISHDTASHLQEARDYMRSISNHGLDVSALYIAQAYLTKLQTSLRPTCTLHALFAQEDLIQMVELCRKGVINVPFSEGYNQRIICEPLLKYFKIESLVEVVPCENTITEVSHLMTRILDKLEEWERIQGKARKIAAKLEELRREKKEFLEVKRMEDSLDAFLDKIMQTQHNKTEYTTLQSLNQTCSIPVSVPQISEEDEKAINEQQIVSFLGYLHMWMGQTLQEIFELKTILELANSQSSIDQNCSNVSHLRKQKVSKNSLLTSKIKQGHIDIPKIHANFFDENQLTKGVVTKSVVNHPKSQMSFMAQIRHERASQQQRTTLGSLSLNRELKIKRSSENCTKCEIY